jgi:hypothetical protein
MFFSGLYLVDRIHNNPVTNEPILVELPLLVVLPLYSPHNEVASRLTSR